jgi:drug/metabolite transporter (DMT)-like permease
VNLKSNTIFWAITACLLWSTAYAGIKLGLQYDTPLHFAGVRFMIAALMILPFTVKPPVFIAMIKEHWKVVLFVTVLQTLINYSLFYLGMDLVPGSLGAVIVGSQPLVTAVVAALMHKEDRLTGSKIITIISGISGVVLISAGRQALKIGTAIEFLGVIMILGANVATAVSNVVVSLRSRGLNPFVLSATSQGTGGIILYILSLIIEKPVHTARPALYWIDLLWLSFMAATAFSIWYKLLQRPGVKVSELNLWKFIIPVVGAILSWLIVPGENPELLTIIGMFIITGSLIMFFYNSKRSAKSKKTI